MVGFLFDNIPGFFFLFSFFIFWASVGDEDQEYRYKK